MQNRPQPFPELRGPIQIPSAFKDTIGNNCGFIIYDDADLHCTGAPENIIAPGVGLGKRDPGIERDDYSVKKGKIKTSGF